MQVKGDPVQEYDEAFASWIDDIPTCRFSGIGTATNELYMRDGTRTQRHSFQNRSFRFHVEEYQLYVYGIFQGFYGYRVADYVRKRIPAELLWGQLTPEKSDEEVKDVLRQTFVNVDKEYFESIGEILAKRMVMKCDQEYDESDILKDAEDIVKQGAVGILCVILKNRLFMASVGDCGAVLCRDTEFIPLFCNHTTDNEDEILRLCHLGLDLQIKQPCPHLPDARLTRCFGNYLVKGGYKENTLLSGASKEPIIPEPEVFGAIFLDSDVLILLLFTRSLVSAVIDATSVSDPEEELVQLCKHYLREESSLFGVAQAVVDQVVRIHHDKLEATGSRSDCLEDMALLVRDLRQFRSKDIRACSTLTGSSARPTVQSSTTTDSSEVDGTGKELPVDENGRIKPYVDFAPFYQIWNQRKSSSDQ